MLRLARESVYTPTVSSVDEVVAKINSVDETQINNLIGEFLNREQYTVAAVGPITQQEVQDTIHDLVS